MVRKTSTSAPSASDTTATTSSGGGLLEHRGQHQAGVGGPGLAHRGRQVVGQRAVAHARARAPTALAARPCMPVTATRSTSSAVTPAAFSAGLPGLGAERDVAGLAEALLPRPRPAVAGRAPAVEELVADRGPAQELGDHRGARAVVADQHGGGAVAPGGLVGRRGQPVAQVGHHHQRGAGARRRARCAGRPGPDRRAPPKSKAATSAGWRRAAWTVVALVLSR